ncbi:Sterol 3-beta-glucosyltransferase [Phytophthora cactorum]|uniref:Sterol 3-beta-glucosyltransferase n=1 Tax=Phytophthora cactorum TaxID=29920 RepID=A0A8T1AFP8_9STRA|nr:Sterol 3-beta-glucosyltransferase [Phytophthora cactorum]KAG2879751.1 Sterol 3-beta-glucosyltransferase [Phytophthora cactorum]
MRRSSVNNAILVDEQGTALESHEQQTYAVAACGPDGRILLEFAEDTTDIQQSTHTADTNRRTQTQQLVGNGDISTPSAAAVNRTSMQRPPVMRICIIIVGTRGDVQPFLAIAQRLQQDGHRVRLATHAVYRDFVMSQGVEFYPLGGDPKELAAYMVKTGGHLIPTKIETLTKDVPRNKEMIKEIVNSTWPAVSAPDPDGGGPDVPGKPFQAQAIIANPVSYGHIHVAERLGVPLHIMFPQPWVPTTAFPHPLANMPYTDELKKANYLSYKMVDLLMWQGTEGLINEFRTKVLKLRKIRNGDGGRDLLLDLHIPHAFMWSPELVPKPADWGDIYDVIGTVTLSGGSNSSYTPSPELETFLGRDGGPIFVGFGSMVLADPLATTKMIIEAAQKARARVLIQSSWSDMAGDIDIPDNVFFIGNCPHDWLMPRVCAVVHHGGAGTTAAGLLAGKPTFIVPFFGDQPFWGQAVVKTGVGVRPCPIAQLTTERLREAFVGLMDPALRARALDLRDVMRREDGADEAVRSFYRHLPTQEMFCDLDHERIATRWSVRDRLKLCERCAFIVSERPENAGKKMVSYHCVDYTARGPDSTLAGASSGTGAFFHEFAGAYTSLVREPVKGFSKNGVAGGALGTLKGVGFFLVRPTLGLVQFTDRVVTGHINAHREEGEQKHSSMLDRRFMSAIGVQRGLANSHTPLTEVNCVDNVIFASQKKRKKMLHSINDEFHVEVE